MKTPGGRAATLCLACAAACLGRAGAAGAAEDVTLSGDLRVRSESLFRNDAFSAAGDVHHARMRVRVGVDAKLDDGWDVGIRLATGGSMTSTNQDLDALVDRAEFYVDRAFARFRSGDQRAFELFAGRMPNPYVHSMMLWDSDYNPDGLAEKLTLKGTSADFFLNLGQHVLGEESPTDNNYGPAVYAIQPGVALRLGEGTLAVAAAYYAFIDAGGTGDVPAGSEYAVADVHASWKAKTAGGKPWALWADALTNPEAADHNLAFGVGVDFGSTKGKGARQLSLSYMSIGRDALWIDLCDANFTSGLTDEDMQGFVLGATFGVGKGATFGATYYYKDSRDTDAHENQLEIDLVLKF